MSSSIVAVEEHFWTPKLRDLRRGHDVMSSATLDAALSDLGAGRIAAMDAAGIGMQILSEVEPGAQNFEPADSVRLAQLSNDFLAAAVERYPDRFRGLAMLPTPDPQEAARELERRVSVDGFRGAMIHGLTRGEFIDARKYWGIFERAEGLGVPIYIHPATPAAPVIDAYYKDYPVLIRGALGFTVEAATIATRLVLSGALDEFPNLQIVLGHLGEGLPFMMERCDAIIARHVTMKRRFRDYFRRHFHLSTSGNFSHPALACALAEIGAERVLFAVDYPFWSNIDARAFSDSATISELDRDRIMSTNARALFALPADAGGVGVDAALLPKLHASEAAPDIPPDLR